MVTQLTLKEVLEMAIEKEVTSQRLYLDLSRAIDNEVAQDAFQELARQEKHHQDQLERYLRGELREGALSMGQDVDYKIAEWLDEPEISRDMELKDTFMLAANREMVAHEFYLSIAKIHPRGKVKRLLKELAAQELEHKQRVEFLYTEVAFPQTDGG